MLWHALYCNVFCIFTHNRSLFMPEVLYFTKLSQIVCLINNHILFCQYARCDNKLQKVLQFNRFFGNFNVCYVIHIFSTKVNLCKHLWLRQSSFYMTTKYSYKQKKKLKTKVWIFIGIYIDFNKNTKNTNILKNERSVLKVGIH